MVLSCRDAALDQQPVIFSENAVLLLNFAHYILVIKEKMLGAALGNSAISTALLSKLARSWPGFVPSSSLHFIFEMKPLQTLPPSSFYLKPLPTSSHTLYVPILPHASVSHLQPTSCLLLNSILLLQPVFPHPLMSLYPPNTPPESPIAPQGPSQTQHISPTDKLGHHRLLQSPAAAHIPL